MTPTPLDDRDRPAADDAAAERVVAGLLGARAAADSGRLARIERSLRRRADGRSRRPAGRMRWWAAAAAIPLLIGGGWAAWHLVAGTAAAPPPELDGRPLAAGAWTAGDSERILRWPDGVRARLAAGARAQAGKGSDVRASIAEGHALVDVEPGRQRAVPVRFGSPAGPIEVTGTRFAIMADPVATLVETWRGQVRFRDRAVPAGSGLAVLGAGSAVALTASPWAGGGIGFHPAAAAAYAGGRWLLDARAAPGAPLWSVEGSRSTMIADRDRPPEQRATGRETGTGSVEVAIPAGGWAMWRLPILPSAFRVELQVRLDPTDPVICVPAWTPRLPDRMVPPALAAGPSEWPPTETLRLLRWSTAIVGWQSEDEPIWESVCADQDDRVLQRRLGTGWTPMVGFYAERRSSIILDRIALHQLRLDGGE